MISEERLRAILAVYPRLTIALVGDLFLDRYLEIEAVEELSIETGLEAYQVSRVRNSPGAMGTVMNNLAALGVGLLVPVTVIGDDGHGYDLLRQVRRLPVDPRFVLADPQRLTPTYTKPMKPDADGAWHELNRLDVRTRGPLNSEACQRLCENLRQAFQSSDGLIVLDQINEENWGVVNDDVREVLDELSRDDSSKLIYVDSRAHLTRFHCGVLKGNQIELLRAAESSGNDESAVQHAAAELSRRTGQPVFCTLGERGMLVVQPDSQATHVPGCPVTGPIDIVGAGDSATAGIVASLLAGANEIEAAAVGNLVASITVQQLGTTGTATPDQVLAAFGA
jgi:rfaE bifunctional protein kinase chain/domain